jgi:hypothetical protein
MIERQRVRGISPSGVLLPAPHHKLLPQVGREPEYVCMSVCNCTCLLGLFQGFNRLTLTTDRCRAWHLTGPL